MAARRQKKNAFSKVVYFFMVIGGITASGIRMLYDGTFTGGGFEGGIPRQLMIASLCAFGGAIVGTLIGLLIEKVISSIRRS